MIATVVSILGIVVAAIAAGTAAALLLATLIPKTVIDLNEDGDLEILDEPQDTEEIISFCQPGDCENCDEDGCVM